MNCPECSSSQTKITRTVPHGNGVATYWHCKSCGAGWQTG